MSHVSELRGVLVDLLLGSRGTTRTVTPGRFTQETPDLAGDMSPPADAAERRFKVVVMEAGGSRPYNAGDGFKLELFDVVIRLSYSLTNAGGDMVDGLTPQHGAGTLDEVMSRAPSDSTEIERVLSWHENTHGVAAQGGAGTLDAIRDRANSDRMEIERVLAWVENTTGQAVSGATMIGCFENSDKPPSGASRGTVYVYEIFYKMMANVTAGSSEVLS